MATPIIYKFTSISSEIIRPLVPVKIVNPFTKQEIRTTALIDTGADNCVFPEFIALNTGHILKATDVQTNVTQGVGKNMVHVWKHTFDIHLLDPKSNETIWKSKSILIDCLDHNEAPVLLGSSNFLCNFKITLNYVTKNILIDLKPSI